MVLLWLEQRGWIWFVEVRLIRWLPVWCGVVKYEKKKSKISADQIRSGREW
jgi:hypothetical protein